MKGWIPVTAVEQRHSWAFEVGLFESSVHPLTFIALTGKALALGVLFALIALKSSTSFKSNGEPAHE